jgi:hypothetical protein
MERSQPANATAAARRSPCSLTPCHLGHVGASPQARQLTCEPIFFQVYDEDTFKADDDLGVAEISTETLTELLHKGIAGGTAEFELPLSLQGSLTVSVRVDKLRKPRPIRTASLFWREVIVPLLMSARASFLYQRVPYDMNAFGNLRNWKYVVLLLLASNTNKIIRGLFFTFYLMGALMSIRSNAWALCTTACLCCDPQATAPLPIALTWQPDRYHRRDGAVPVRPLHHDPQVFAVPLRHTAPHPVRPAGPDPL